MNTPHLGIHSKYEICSGSRSFEDYIEKAKFYGIDTLAISDQNTLGGTLAFQTACQKADINFILGETVTVKRKDEFYPLKLYVKNKAGWQNLLRINKAIRVDNDHFIDEPELLDRANGLILVIPVDAAPYVNKAYYYKFKNHFKDIYFQLDTTEWVSNERDKNYLLNMERLLKELYPPCPPVLIHDSYYLDKEDGHIKKKLNDIGKVESYTSHDQYFKNHKELLLSLSKLFKEGDDRLHQLWDESVSGALEIAEKCKFEIETRKLHLPKYKLTKEEQEKYGDSYNMFNSLIQDGLKRIGRENDKEYLDRVEYEKSVIDEGGYRDYFVITYDIVEQARKMDVAVNLGRGSASASLCLYCLNVTGINPIEYDLPFDRFLNSARVKKGLPDCDLDFASDGRDKVKRYIIKKYGFNHVAFVGTYGLLKIKSALKEVAKIDGSSFKDINYITATFPKKVADEPKKITDLFKYSLETPTLKNFIKNNVNTIHDTFLVNDSIKNIGEHAAAVIIFPDQDDEGNEMNVWDWVPCKKVDDHLTTEFSGVELDTLGYLKEDILGLQQLDKVDAIFKLVKNNHNEEYSLTNVPLKDGKTFWMFQEGYTQDVFQFNGDGMTSFLMELIPENIDHLIAANALYRPGAMGVDGHTNYAKVKNGIKLPDYLWGTEEITKETYGVLCYQEQVMRACVDLADFSLADADMIRKAIGKKDEKLLDSYKPQFLEKVISKGCPESEANRIWSTFEGFGQYAFNLGHAACYTLLGYTTMYLKAHYPIEFYSVALQFASDDTKPKIISEMNRLGEARVMPPSINESELKFKPDFQTKKIYWSLTSVKYVGEKAVEKIIEERNKNGNFFSVQDLFDRVDKRTVNKRAINNLILSGAFDEAYSIKQESDRMGIIREYYEQVLEEDIPEEFKDHNNTTKNHWWIMQAITLTGLGFIDYKSVLPDSFDRQLLINPIKFNQKESLGNDIVVCGIITQAIERNSKRGKFMTLELDHNSEIINALVWNEVYESNKEKFKNCVGKLIFMSGVVKFDSFRQKNSVQSNDNSKIDII